MRTHAGSITTTYLATFFALLLATAGGCGSSAESASTLGNDGGVADAADQAGADATVTEDDAAAVGPSCEVLGALGPRTVDRFEASGMVIYNPFLQIARLDAADGRVAITARQRTDSLDELRLSVVDLTGEAVAAPRRLEALPDHDSEFTSLVTAGDRFAVFWNEARDEPADPQFTVHQYYALFDADGAPVVAPRSLGQWWASARPAVTDGGTIGAAIGHLYDWSTQQARLSLALIDDPAAPSLDRATPVVDPYPGGFAAYRLLWQQAKGRFVLLLQREDDERIVAIPVARDGTPGEQRDTGVAARIQHLAVTSDGHLGLLWREDQGDDPDQPSSTLRLQILSPDLDPLPATVVDTRAEHDAIALVAEGEQLVAFWSAPAGEQSRLHALRVASDGQPLGDATELFDYRPFFASRLAATPLGQGRFAFAWVALDEATGGYALIYRPACL